MELPGAGASGLGGINNVGVIVGSRRNVSNIATVFLVQRTRLKRVRVPDAKSTSAQDVNDFGEIVAFYTDTKCVIDGFTRTSSGPECRFSWSYAHVPAGSKQPRTIRWGLR
jgi:hypothetical protein